MYGNTKDVPGTKKMYSYKKMYGNVGAKKMSRTKNNVPEQKKMSRTKKM